MSDADLTFVLLTLLLLLGFAHLFGFLFVRLRQPRVVGEILAGVIIGPAVAGQLPLPFWLKDLTQHKPDVLSFVYWLGLLLLMFLSGVEARNMLNREERRVVAWLTIMGTGLPFALGLILGPWLTHPALLGPKGNQSSLTIVLAVGVAVTSVPVASKIFADLKILHTRFARLVLGVAVLEDIVLWLALAVATAIAGTTALEPRKLLYHLTATVSFFWLGSTIMPQIMRRLNASHYNVFARQAPIAYVTALLLAYCVVAGTLGVSMVFAAFLAGFAVAQDTQGLFSDALTAIGKVSFAFFIPVYFGLVGLKLDLLHAVSWWMIVIFLGSSCIVKILSVSVAARCAGFRGLDIFNLAITTNARGGPGIVLASVAFDSGIVSAGLSIQRWS